MPVNRVIGFDPSLTSSGYAFWDRNKDELVSGLIKTSDMRGVERLWHIRTAFGSLCMQITPSIIVYEGYSMGSHSGRNFDIGELGGVLKIFAYLQGIPLLLVPPTVLKKFIAGKGNASKEEVVLKLYKRFGYEAPQNDQADAIGLYLFGDAYLNADPKINDLVPKCQVVEPKPRRERRIRRITA